MSSSKFLQHLLKYKFILPPLSGYTDYPYRVILAKFKPPFIITEMVSAQAVIRKNPRTMQILKKVEGTHFNGVQLFGSDPKIMGQAANIVEGMGFDYIDINMGCTIKKVARRGAGISLMKNEECAYLVTKSVVDSVNIPVTCKLRLGATKQNVNVVCLSEKLKDAGATALVIHGRTGEKKFGLPIDFNLIKSVVDNLSIPVVANGGIFTGADAENMIKKTCATAVMPGRGIIGNPWIISELLSVFSSKSFSAPTLNAKKKICLEHLQHLRDFYGESRGIIKMRKILAEYFLNCHNLKNLKLEVQHVSSYSKMFELLENIYKVDDHIVYDNISD
jgi:tRNA-dihydrouridine synthase B